MKNKSTELVPLIEKKGWFGVKLNIATKKEALFAIPESGKFHVDYDTALKIYNYHARYGGLKKWENDNFLALALSVNQQKLEQMKLAKTKNEWKMLDIALLLERLKLIATNKQDLTLLDCESIFISRCSIEELCKKYKIILD